MSLVTGSGDHISFATIHVPGACNEVKACSMLADPVVSHSGDRGVNSVVMSSFGVFESLNGVRMIKLLCNDVMKNLSVMLAVTRCDDDHPSCCKLFMIVTYISFIIYG